MSTEENKALVRRFWNGLNKGDIDAMMEMVAPDAVDHGIPPGSPSGPKGIRQMITTSIRAFPDLHFTIEDMIAEGDKVVCRISQTGTNTGELMGMPPTGKQVKVTSIGIFRIENGKLVEHWSNQDDLGRMQQLGIVPMPGQAQV